MLWAALLHDIGKGFCKNFKVNSRYANYIGHENVGAQKSISLLNQVGYTDEFILQVAKIVQYHMRLLNLKDNERAKNKFKNFIGNADYEKLIFFQTADDQAK